MPADDTGRRLIRQAQREGRLGTLSPEARKCLGDLAALCAASEAREGGTGYQFVSSTVDSARSTWDTAEWFSHYNPGYEAQHARELGAFLAQLAGWLS